LDENYKPLYFTNIVGAPHDIPKSVIDKLHIFQGNNAMLAGDHWNPFMTMMKRTNVQHQDMLMKLFILSLEEDVVDWFTSLLDNNINTFSQLESIFIETWEEKDNIYLLVALMGALEIYICSNGVGDH
jgi:hypothetical protein